MICMVIKCDILQNSQAGGPWSSTVDGDVDDCFIPMTIRDHINGEASKSTGIFQTLGILVKYKDMLSNMSPSVLGYADTMQIIIGKHP